MENYDNNFIAQNYNEKNKMIMLMQSKFDNLQANVNRLHKEIQLLNDINHQLVNKKRKLRLERENNFLDCISYLKIRKRRMFL